MNRRIAFLGLLALLAHLDYGCTFNRRMQHIRRGVYTEAQWFVSGDAVEAPKPSPAREVKPKPVQLPAERSVLAVMEIEDTSGTMDPVYLANALEMLRGKLSATGHFIVIDRGRQEEKLKQLVREQKKESYRQCYDESCQIPLGQALAADSILRTTISCLGTACMLSAELVDLEKEAAISGGTADFDADPASLKKAVDAVTGQLIDRVRK
jgi:hypothetical protein